MPKTPPSFTRRVVAVIGSSKFFWGISIVIVLQAIWIAITARYPMAFDEDFHLGIIRLYASHPSPFWSGQPDGANAFGAIARDPSYLYHLLMSLPYQFICLFTQNEAIQVLFLRFINIAIFASGLPLYRRLLQRTGASNAIINACFAVFALTPIIPLVVGQINYDNLLLPVTALTLLTALKFTDVLRDKKRIDARLLTYLLVLCMLGSLVKYAFLPIVLAVVVYVVVCLWRAFPNLGKIWKQFVRSLKALSVRSRWILGMLFVLSFGLFSERYLVNIVQYHKPIPECGAVLNVDACLEYGPWARDYRLSHRKDSTATSSPITFTGDWFYGMWMRTFFAVDGPTTHFQTRGPLVLPGIGAVVFASIAGVAILLRGRRVFRRYNKAALSLFGLVTICYIGALWFDQYQRFVHTGQPVAINGRYLAPLLLPILLIGALSLNELFGRFVKAKLLFAGVVIICLLWGGGALTYILRSNDAWYWPSAPRAVYDTNHAVQRVLGPITPGYDHPTQYLH